MQAGLWGLSWEHPPTRARPQDARAGAGGRRMVLAEGPILATHPGLCPWGRGLGAAAAAFAASHSPGLAADP